MLSKEEIEDVEEIKKMLSFTTEGTSLRINNQVSKLLLKYINDLEQSNKIIDTECSKLEQKESILDKVTDKLKEIDTKYTNEYKNIEKLELIEGNTAVLQELSCVLDDIYKILNIAKGEKK